MPTRLKPGSPPARDFVLKITLLGSDPLIWRRVVVAEDTTMENLHYVVQIAMGWQSSHLHQFIKGKRMIGIPDPDFDEDIEDERKIRLNELISRARQKIRYEYDFGDGWEHEILLERTAPPEIGRPRPRCEDGAMACPPEDCGGIWGYYDLLEALRSRKHPRHKELREWIGGDFDPEEFDVDDVNHELKRIKAWKRAAEG